MRWSGGGLLLVLAAVRGVAAAEPDPLAAYYGNTIVCLDEAGGDFCHIWLDQGGRFIRFGALEAPQAGRFTAAPAGPGMRVCLHGETGGFAAVAGFAAARPAGDRCYTLEPHDLGDRWTDPDDDAATAGAAPRRLMLAPGQR